MRIYPRFPYTFALLATAASFGFGEASSQAQTATTFDLVLGGPIVQQYTPPYTPEPPPTPFPPFPPMPAQPARNTTSVNTLISSPQLQMVADSTQLVFNITFEDDQILNLAASANGLAFEVRLEASLSSQAFQNSPNYVTAPGQVDYIGLSGTPISSFTPTLGVGSSQFIFGGTGSLLGSGTSLSGLTLTWGISDVDPNAIISITTVYVRLTDYNYAGPETPLPELLSFTAAPIPEPSHIALLTTGLMAGTVAFLRRTRR